MSTVSPALQAVGSGITRPLPHEPTPQLRCPAPERLRRHRVAAAPDMAMAGGTQPEHLDAALASVSNWVKAKIMKMVSPALLVAPAPGLRLPWRERYPSVAMAGGTQPENLVNALASVADWVKARA